MSSSANFSTSSIGNAETVNLSSTDYTPTNGVTRAIYVGGAGDVKVDLAGGSTGITFPGMPVGWHPIMATKIYKTGTAATNIVAGW